MSYLVKRGSDVEPPREARDMWVYELYERPDAKGAIIERCGDYPTEAYARSEAEKMLAARRFNAHDPNAAKQGAAWVSVVQFIERQKSAKVLAEKAAELDATKGQLADLQAEKDAALAMAHERVAKAAVKALNDPRLSMLLECGHAVLNDPSSVKKGGSKTTQIYGLHAVEAANERPCDVAAFRALGWKTNNNFRYSPWDQPWPKGQTEQNYLRLMADAFPKHPWKLPPVA